MASPATLSMACINFILRNTNIRLSHCCYSWHILKVLKVGSCGYVSGKGWNWMGRMDSLASAIGTTDPAMTVPLGPYKITSWPLPRCNCVLRFWTMWMVQSSVLKPWHGASIQTVVGIYGGLLPYISALVWYIWLFQTASSPNKLLLFKCH